MGCLNSFPANMIPFEHDAKVFAVIIAEMTASIKIDEERFRRNVDDIKHSGTLESILSDYLDVSPDSEEVVWPILFICAKTTFEAKIRQFTFAEAKIGKMTDDFNASLRPRLNTVDLLRKRLAFIEHRQRNPLPLGIYQSQLLTLEHIDTGMMCMHSDPCQHYVSVRGKVIGRPLFGTEVARLFEDNFLPIPEHFQKYLGPFY